MIHYKPVGQGMMTGVQYDFECAGDTIPMHTHTADLDHTVRVLRGAVRVNNRVLGPNDDVYWFDNSIPHEIVALLPQTRIVNTFVAGCPPEYRGVPPEQLTGVLGVVRSIDHATCEQSS